ncbi:MAG: CocE/NonD family hydrolase, partial [Puniceicoccaceae bacterium]
MPTSKAADQTPGKLDIRVEYGVALELKDGVKLSADIYHPPGKARAPVLLMRQPYGKEIASTVVYAQPEYFARRGFLVVIQDVRGRGASEGEFYAFRNEDSDGLASIEWAAGLAGSNGKVCMYGFSYQAYTQLAVLGEAPSALVAIAPHMVAADLYNGWFYSHQGMLQLSSTLAWGNQLLREDTWRRGLESEAAALEAAWTNVASLFRTLPVQGCEPLTLPNLPSYVRDWLTHVNYDAYWAEIDRTADLAASPLPVFHLTGYYDYYASGSCGAYACRSKEQKAKDFFVLGPWKHIPWERWHGDFDFGSSARPDTDALLCEWLEAQLNPKRTSKLMGARYFLMGANKWQTAPSWPPPEAAETSFYLRSDGAANSCFGDGKLTRESALGAPDNFVYDPEVPTLAPGGNQPVWGPVDLLPQQQG